MSALQLSLVAGPIERVPADVAVVGYFEDERPLRGGAGRADWRLCGTLSRLIQRGKLCGAFGEAALLPGTGGMRARWVLALGLGERDDFDRARRRELARDCVRRAIDLQAGVLALPLPPAGREDAGPEERLDLLLEVLSRAAPGLQRSVRVRLVAAPEEQPALAELLLRLAARGELLPGVSVDPPASVERSRRGTPAGGAARPVASRFAAELRVK